MEFFFLILTGILWETSDGSIRLSIENGKFVSTEEFIKPNLDLLPDMSNSFEDMRLKNLIYVDKTEFLGKLINLNARLLLITRPRRFGKSVFLQMVKHFYLDDQHLFNYLAITKWEKIKDYEGKKFPVIDLDFRSINFQTGEEFRLRALLEMEAIADSYKVDIGNLTISRLIQRLHTKYNSRVVVLVDEYDYPLSKAVTTKNTETIEQVKLELDAFFGEIKSASGKGRIEKAILIGVNRMALSSLESGPNSFKDITNDFKFATAFGITSKEFQLYFKNYVRNCQVINKQDSFQNYLKEIMKMYDGYKFSVGDDSISVLNPVSTIEFLQSCNLWNHWSKTSSLSFLISKIHSKDVLNHLFNDDCKMTSEDIREKYDITKEYTPITNLMLHYGYVTLGKYDKDDDLFEIKIPNGEIRDTLDRALTELKGFDEKEINNSSSLCEILQYFIHNSDISGILSILKSIAFGNSSLVQKPQDLEYTMTHILATIFRTCEINCTRMITFTENKITKGDIDLFVKVNGVSYVTEFKVAEPAITGMKKYLKYWNEKSFWEAVDLQEKEKVHFLAISMKWVPTPQLRYRMNQYIVMTGVMLNKKVKIDISKPIISHKQMKSDIKKWFNNTTLSSIDYITVEN